MLIRRELVEEAIRLARTSVDLICPYFYPGHRFRQALCAAARRGVRVRLLLQGKVEDTVEADEIFSLLMGEAVEPRREFIEKNALDVQNLDI